MYMTRLISLCIILFCSLFAHSQIIIDNTVNENTAVDDILLGSGVVASNIQFTGDANQIGSFNSNGSILPIGEGVILATGNCNLASGTTDYDDPDAPGPGGNNQGSSSLGGGNDTASDSDLEAISNATIGDAAVLEFDFVATGETVEFNFIFASEEYPEYVCGTVNDAFGFFLSGPGIDGGGMFSNNAVNLAIVPGTTPPIPVTINSVNPGVVGDNGTQSNCDDIDPNWADHSIYYTDNSSMSSNSTVIEYDGFTVVMNATYDIQCGETYHIKMAIGDGGGDGFADTSFDSAVFLEASSFSSNAFQLELTNDLGYAPNDSTVFEDCGDQVFRFTRPEDQTAAITFPIVISGTAENGVDYTGIPTAVAFAQDETVTEFPFTIFQDNLDEPLESVTITYTSISCAGGTVDTDFTFYIQDIEPLSVSLEDANSDCNTSATLIPIIVGGVGEYTFVWNDDHPDLEREVSPGTTTTYTITVTDVCNIPSASASSIVTVPFYPPVVIDPLNDVTLNCGEPLEVFSSVSGGNGDFTYNWVKNAASLSTDPNLMTTPNLAGEITLELEDGCQQTTSESFELSFTPISLDLGSNLTLQCLDDLELIPVVNGPIDSYSYSWTSDGENVGNETTYQTVITSSQTIALIITDDCNQEARDEVVIAMPASPIDLEMTENQRICLSDSVKLIGLATGGIGELFYGWLPTREDTDLITVSPTITTTYTLFVNDVCNNQAEGSVIVTVDDLQAGFNINKLDDQNIEFFNATNIPAAFSWDFDDGTTSTEEDPTHFFADPYIPYLITLTAINEIGCTDTVSFLIDPPPLIWIPNSFTPNNDGINEALKIVGSSLSEFSILIFDRNGHLVYESKDPEGVWNGSRLGGNYYVPDGIYNYILVAKGKNKEVIEKKGHISVFR